MLALIKDVIEVIKDTAFIASDHPVILSFENHCRYIVLATVGKHGKL